MNQTVAPAAVAGGGASVQAFQSLGGVDGVHHRGRLDGDEDEEDDYISAFLRWDGLFDPEAPDSLLTRKSFLHPYSDPRTEGHFVDFISTQPVVVTLLSSAAGAFVLAMVFMYKMNHYWFGVADVIAGGILLVLCSLSIMGIIVPLWTMKDSRPSWWRRVKKIIRSITVVADNPDSDGADEGVEVEDVKYSATATPSMPRPRGVSFGTNSSNSVLGSYWNRAERRDAEKPPLSVTLARRYEILCILSLLTLSIVHTHAYAQKKLCRDLRPHPDDNPLWKDCNVDYAIHSSVAVIFVLPTCVLNLRFLVVAPILLLWLILYIAFRPLAPIDTDEEAGLHFLVLASIALGCIITSFVKEYESRKRFEIWVRLIRNAGRIHRRQQSVEQILRQLLPASAIGRLSSERVLVESNPKCSIGIFCIDDFYRCCWSYDTQQLVQMLICTVTMFDAQIQKRVLGVQLHKIGTQGDRYIVSAGLRTTQSSPRERDSAVPEKSDSDLPAPINEKDGSESIALARFSFWQLKQFEKFTQIGLWGTSSANSVASDSFVHSGRRPTGARSLQADPEDLRRAPGGHNGGGNSEPQWRAKVALGTGSCAGALIGIRSLGYEVQGEAYSLANALVPLTPPNKVVGCARTAQDLKDLPSIHLRPLPTSVEAGVAVGFVLDRRPDIPLIQLEVPCPSTDKAEDEELKDQPGIESPAEAPAAVPLRMKDGDEPAQVEIEPPPVLVSHSIQTAPFPVTAFLQQHTTQQAEAPPPAAQQCELEVNVPPAGGPAPLMEQPPVVDDLHLELRVITEYTNTLRHAKLLSIPSLPPSLQTMFQEWQGRMDAVDGAVGMGACLLLSLSVLVVILLKARDNAVGLSLFAASTVIIALRFAIKLVRPTLWNPFESAFSAFLVHFIALAGLAAIRFAPETVRDPPRYLFLGAGADYYYITATFFTLFWNRHTDWRLTSAVLVLLAIEALLCEHWEGYIVSSPLTIEALTGLLVMSAAAFLNQRSEHLYFTTELMAFETERVAQVKYLLQQRVLELLVPKFALLAVTEALSQEEENASFTTTDFECSEEDDFDAQVTVNVPNVRSAGRLPNSAAAATANRQRRAPTIPRTFLKSSVDWLAVMAVYQGSETSVEPSQQGQVPPGHLPFARWEADHSILETLLHELEVQSEAQSGARNSSAAECGTPTALNRSGSGHWMDSFLIQKIRSFHGTTLIGGPFMKSNTAGATHSIQARAVRQLVELAGKIITTVPEETRRR